MCYAVNILLLVRNEFRRQGEKRLEHGVKILDKLYELQFINYQNLITFKEYSVIGPHDMNSSRSFHWHRINSLLLVVLYTMLYIQTENYLR